MSQDPESKSLINGGSSDLARKGWVGKREEKSFEAWQIWHNSIKKKGWKPVITEPGAATQVKRHTSLNHRAIIPQKHKTVPDGCSPALINAQFLFTGFGELPLDVRHV